MISKFFNKEGSNSGDSGIEISIRDWYVATYLAMNNIEPVRIAGKTIIYTATEEVKSLIAGYYSGALVNANDFVNSYRTMRHKLMPNINEQKDTRD